MNTAQGTGTLYCKQTSLILKVFPVTIHQIPFLVCLMHQSKIKYTS
uniref:Uncharacterized protein n=1 Tax=Rhizophora mucronata TaxID=61149 RepID=A0A2P2PW79_RHIMU